MQVAISRRLIERCLFPKVNKAFAACVVAFNKFAVYLTARKDPGLNRAHRDVIIRQQVPSLLYGQEKEGKGSSKCSQL